MPNSEKIGNGQILDLAQRHFASQVDLHFGASIPHFQETPETFLCEPFYYLFGCKMSHISFQLKREGRSIQLA